MRTALLWGAELTRCDSYRSESGQGGRSPSGRGVDEGAQFDHGRMCAR